MRHSFLKRLMFPLLLCFFFCFFSFLKIFIFLSYYTPKLKFSLPSLLLVPCLIISSLLKIHFSSTSPTKRTVFSEISTKHSIKIIIKLNIYLHIKVGGNPVGRKGLKGRQTSQRYSHSCQDSPQEHSEVKV